MADITVTAANVLKTAATIGSGTAGEAITAGQPVYLKASDSKLYKAQADGTAEEVAAVGIALHGAGANQPLSYAGNGSTLNIGGTTAKAITYCVSAAAGGIAPMGDLTSGQRICELGHASATDGSFVIRIVNRGHVV